MDYLDRIERFGKLARLTRNAFVKWEQVYSEMVDLKCAETGQFNVVSFEEKVKQAQHFHARYQTLLEVFAEYCGISQDRCHYFTGCAWNFGGQVKLFDAFAAADRDYALAVH